ncbi:MAG: hypothetical protein JW871_08275 [Endomicrobiales bacterium]|nr:hypothetical protein [Endomicrobiales bacterium]
MTFTFTKLDWMFTFAVLTSVVLLVLYWNLQKKRNVVIWRMLTLILMVFLLCQPVLVNFSIDKKPLVAVALDVSSSMYISDRIKPSQEFIKENEKLLKNRLKLKQYTFAFNANEVGNLSRIIETEGKNYTDLYQSLWEIRRENSEKLTGIMLLSDGNHNSEALHEDWIKDLNVPIFPVAIGSKRKIRDLAINSIRVSDFAFKNIPLDIAVELSAVGFKNKKITVNLKRIDSGAGILTTRTINVNTDNENIELVMHYTPQISGRFKYEVEVVPGTGEVTKANNRKRFDLDIILEKLRILYICGQPGPEYSFLRHHLKNDPMVELVSFVILRNPENITLVPDNDLALIPFPVSTIFTQDLYDFDVMILENFTYRRFGFTDEYLKNIRNWVISKGGGFVMIAGENAFGKGGWGGTPVEEILPVVLDKPSDSYDRGLFQVKVTDIKHDIMNLNDENSRNDSLWRGMPKLDGCQALLQREGAETLLKHPWNDWVVLSCWEKGKGRVVALGSNTTWRWALQNPTPELYNTFWRNVIRYVSRSEESDKWHLVFDRPNYYSGQDFVLNARHGKDLEKSKLKVGVYDPQGDKYIISLTNKGRNEWTGKGTFEKPGTYRFQLLAENNGRSIVKKTKTVNVEPSLIQEEMFLNINEQMLNKIAKSSGGEYFSADGFSIDEILDKLKKVDSKIITEKIPLWHYTFWLVLIILSFLGEWFYRRRNGMW